MDLIREFEAHASECRRMAEATVDRASRATWTRMADRWTSLAEKRRAEVIAPRPKRRRPDRAIYRRPEDTHAA